MKYNQPIGCAVGGFTVGNAATMVRCQAVGTIVGVEDRDGRRMVTVEFDDPQPVDVPEGATSKRFELPHTSITSTWATSGGSVEVANELMDIVVTKIGSIDVGIDGRDEYLLLRNREGDLSPDQAIAYLRPLVYREGRGPGSYFCTTVNAVQKLNSTDTAICTIEHRYDV